LRSSATEPLIDHYSLKPKKYGASRRGAIHETRSRWHRAETSANLTQRQDYGFKSSQEGDGLSTRFVKHRGANPT
jgi:hypothetical protein